jgi:hypothetical protein
MRCSYGRYRGVEERSERLAEPRPEYGHCTSDEGGVAPPADKRRGPVFVLPSAVGVYCPAETLDFIRLGPLARVGIRAIGKWV